MTQDEVRMLDNRYALLFIRGEWQVMDLNNAKLIELPDTDYVCVTGGKNGNED